MHWGKSLDDLLKKLNDFLKKLKTLCIEVKEPHMFVKNSKIFWRNSEELLMMDRIREALIPKGSLGTKGSPPPASSPCFSIKLEREKGWKRQTAKYFKQGFFVYIVVCLTFQPQNSLPDVVISMMLGNKRIAYYRMPSEDVLYSKNQYCRGMYCGKQQNIILKVNFSYHVARFLMREASHKRVCPCVCLSVLLSVRLSHFFTNL